MDFAHRVPRMLHEEHMATVGMLNDLEDLLARSGKTPPDTADAPVAGTLGAVARVIGEEVHGHFAFEENELFTRLAELGDEAIGQHLGEEHEAILPLGERVAAEARAALGDGFTPATWDGFRAGASELVERMMAHVQKEEMALLPVLDDMLDADTDFALCELRGGQS